jgi:EAL domain-containing protein (putative c-di-GMP-specific phosphodiesterase class I)
MGETMLDRLQEPGALRVVFQPILQYDKSGWRVHALEALVRGPRGTHMEFPDVLFEYVRRKGAEVLMDRHCLSTVLRGARGLGTEITLSVNVHAATLEQDEGFVSFLGEQVEQVGRTPARVIVEIVEHSPPWAGKGFGQALESLRERGFPVALDDVGLGQSNFRMILECRPDYFKMDAFLIQGAHIDYYRRAVLRSIVDLAGSFGATAVAEGLDSVEDLRIVLDEGVRVVQGYLLARPVAAEVLGERVGARRLAESRDQCRPRVVQRLDPATSRPTREARARRIISAAAVEGEGRLRWDGPANRDSRRPWCLAST